MRLLSRGLRASMEMLSGARENPMTEALALEIESLRRLKTKALQARYQEIFGEESRSSNHVHLFRRIVWRLQAREEGDRSERARKQMLELADDHHLRLRAPRSFWDSIELGPDPKPGSARPTSRNHCDLARGIEGP